MLSVNEPTLVLPPHQINHSAGQHVRQAHWLNRSGKWQVSAEYPKNITIRALRSKAIRTGTLQAMLEHQCNKLYILQVVDYTGKTNKLENFEKLSCLLKRARLNKSAFMSIELKMKPKEWTILMSEIKRVESEKKQEFLWRFFSEKWLTRRWTFARLEPFENRTLQSL